MFISIKKLIGCRYNAINSIKFQKLNKKKITIQKMKIKVFGHKIHATCVKYQFMNDFIRKKFMQMLEKHKTFVNACNSTNLGYVKRPRQLSDSHLHSTPSPSDNSYR